MKLLFDLDGTILNSMVRMYQLFQTLVPTSKFTHDDYWALKRNKVSHHVILRDYFHYSIIDIEIFERAWMKLIESDEFLSFDTLLPGVASRLSELQCKHSLYILTARQCRSKVIKQLESFSLLEFFTDVFVTEAKVDKYELIRVSNLVCNSSDWMIGDTGHDILVGKKLGIQTAAVTCGFLSKTALLEYQPDIIEENICKLIFD